MVGKYKDALEAKKANFRIVNNLKMTNGFRSLFDLYQQEAEYEARLKVNQMEKDILVKEFVGKNEIPEFRRNLKIVNQRQDEESEKWDEQRDFEDFFARSKNLLKQYYEDAYTRDRLGNLTDKEILYTLKETPSKIKKSCESLLKFAERHGVKILEDGTADFSQCTSEQVKSKLENNSLLRYAALQRQTNYGFVHLEQRKKAAEEIKRELLMMRSTDNRLEQEATKEERELQLRKQALQSDIDKKIGFLTSGGYTGRVGDDDSGGKHAEPKDLIEGYQYRLDSHDLLLESFPERLLRLEKKWITERMSNITGGVEKEDEEENSQRLGDITDKIRRVKLKLDQEAIHQARDILFEEHSKLSMKELLNERVPIERLLNYYSLPVDQRQPGINEDLEFTTVKATVRRKEVVEDLVPGFEVDSRTQLKAEDSVEYRKIAQTKLNNEKILKRSEVKESVETTKAESIETAVNERKPTKGSQSKEGGQAAKAEVVGIIRRRLLGLSEQEGPVDKSLRTNQRVSTFLTKQELRKAKREKKATPGIDKKGSVDKKK